MLAKRLALVTGANRVDGIGFEIARVLATDHGFAVLIGGRTETSGAEAVKQLKSNGIEDAWALEIDPSNPENIRKAYQTVEQTWGRLDVLVNNAGMALPTHVRNSEAMKKTPGFSPMQHDSQVMQEVFMVNVSGVADTINTFLPLLNKSPEPRIVNTSSSRGSLAYGTSLPVETAGIMIYNASKSALNMLTLMYAKHLPNMKVNAGSPGHTRTAFNNYTGARTVQAAARVLVWLATLPQDGPTGGHWCDHPPWSSVEGEFKQVDW